LSSTSRKRKANPKKVKKEGAAEEVEKEVKKVEKAVVKEAKKVEKAVEHKAKPKVQQRPSGRVPQAMVTARHGTGTITRQAKGFSPGELAGGGLHPSLAAKWGVRVDGRRRSTLEGNVTALRSWHSSGAKMAVEREAKAVEEELKGAGKEVEREVVVAAREVVKAEKAVKKEAKRAEKAVKEKVERPKARPKKKKS
jgi:ribosomal protein L13E